MLAAAMKLKDACSLEEKIMTYLVGVLKSRDITLPTDVHLVKVMVFQYSCMDVSCTIKKAESQKVDELWC